MYVLLADTPLLKVVGSYTTGREAIQGIADVCPDVALIALGLPDMSGVEVIQHITAQSSPTECVVLTVYDDNAHPFPALRAVEAAAVFRGARKR
jgi:DNA-binding NarL/FixJ family response regulator